MRTLFLGLLFISGPIFGADLWQLRFSSAWGEEKMILLTGFGPFGDIVDNPSGRIVHALKTEIERRCSSVGSLKGAALPVVPGIIEKYSPETFDTVISVGVHGGGDGVRLEIAARNYYYDFETGESRRIDLSSPASKVVYGPPIPASIPNELEGFAISRGTETSAGTYVCNDTYYRLCEKKKTRGYFVHIPNIPRSEDGRLTRALGEISCRLFD